MTTMFNPPHPGETLREDVLPALGLTVTEAAAQLGVTRAALSRVLNGRAAISPEMALRLEGWLGVENGGSADAWIAQQAAYDLWKARVAEGHAFGSHTWRHGAFRQDEADGKVVYRLMDGNQIRLDASQVCAELKQPDTRFAELTGRKLDPLWRAPGGRTTPNTLKAAEACGYRHVGWAPAGFLGDELPSDAYPNETLLKRALARIHDGDILMAHLGIWSRKEPFAPMLDPLIGGLKAKGFCFATIPSR